MDGRNRAAPGANKAGVEAADPRNGASKMHKFMRLGELGQEAGRSRARSPVHLLRPPQSPKSKPQDVPLTALDHAAGRHTADPRQRTERLEVRLRLRLLPGGSSLQAFDPQEPAQGWPTAALLGT